MPPGSPPSSDGQEPQAPARLDLNTALTAFNGDAATSLRAALVEALKYVPGGDLSVVDEADLIAQDSVQRSRLVYVVSLLRLLDFLRKDATGNDTLQESQAKLALAYIRHAESSGLGSIQIGRTRKEAELVAEVQALRRQNDEVAAYKAQRALKERAQGARKGRH